MDKVYVAHYYAINEAGIIGVFNSYTLADNAIREWVNTGFDIYHFLVAIKEVEFNIVQPSSVCQP